jgi:hypothetical protein
MRRDYAVLAALALSLWSGFFMLGRYVHAHRTYSKARSHDIVVEDLSSKFTALRSENQGLRRPKLPRAPHPTTTMPLPDAEM